MEHVTTQREVEAALERHDCPVLVQFGKHDCPRCGPFTEAVEALKTEFTFEHIVVTVTDAPELVERFEVARLPAFVILTSTWLSKGEGEAALVQAARPEQVQSAVRLTCNPKLRLDEDF
jgi:thiol-disulfide isomerase/thioredoxin